ncbi:MAG: archease [Thermoleophilia bacterium]|nr:archease [Thermoleophilia bacterium]
MEHTAELGLELEGESDEEVFRAALDAFAELVADEGGGEGIRRRIVLEGGERGDLLVRWLEELVFLADAERFVPERVVALELGREGVRAEVAGRLGSPRPLVKAVTYHDVEFARQGGRTRAHVVLDV